MNRRLVEQIKRSAELSDPDVERAFLENPRHLFLPGLDLATVYSNEAIGTHHLPDSQECVSSSSQPGLMAGMLEQLDVRPGMRVLEIGTGTGYNAALLASLAGDTSLVHSVDISETCIAEARRHLDAAGKAGIDLVCGDGWMGLANAAPYDRIIVTASAYDIAPAWLEQLVEGGRIVVPWGLPMWMQCAAAFEKQDNTLVLRSSLRCMFMRMRGVYDWKTNSSDDPAALDPPASNSMRVLISLCTDPISNWDDFAAFAALYLWPDSAMPGANASREIHIGPVRGNVLVQLVTLSYGPPWRLTGRLSNADINRISRVLKRWYDAGQPSMTSLRMTATPLTKEPPPDQGGDWIERTWFRYRISW